MRGGALTAIGLVVAGLGLGLGLASPARATVESQLWTVDISSTATRSETRRPVNFGHLSLTGRFTGTSFTGLGGGSQSGRDGLADDRIGAFTFTTSSSTSIVLRCKSGPALFKKVNVTAKGDVKLRFTDGFGPSIFFGGLGTGFTNAIVGIDGTGDFSYGDRNPGGTVALASADTVEERSGTLSVGPFELGFQGKAADQDVTDGVAGVDNATLEPKSQFSGELRTFAKWNFKVNSEGLGDASNSVEINTEHKGTINGSMCSMGDLTSTLNVSFNDLVATIDITTINTKSGTMVERVLENRWAPTALRRFGYALPHVSPDADTGFDAPGPWQPRSSQRIPRRPVRSYVARKRSPRAAGSGGPTAQPGQTPGRRLGVRKGARARYAVVANRVPLKGLRNLDLRVTEANRESGRVVLSGVARILTVPKGQPVRTTNETFTGDGGLKGLIVPSGLKKGDELYGIGRVTRVTRDRVSVLYRDGPTRLSAKYDRRSGWLVVMTERTPGGGRLKLARLPAA